MRARGLRPLGCEVEVSHAVLGIVGVEVVVREQLDQALVVALLRDECLCHPSVVRRPASVEDALVRDLTDHRALEPVALVFVDVGRRPQQLGDRELGERSGHRLGVRRSREEQVGGERVADDRRLLQHET